MGTQRRPQARIVEEKVLTPEDIAQGLTKFRRRLDEVRALDPARTRHDDPKIRSGIQLRRVSRKKMKFQPTMEALDILRDDLRDVGSVQRRSNFFPGGS